MVDEPKPVAVGPGQGETIEGPVGGPAGMETFFDRFASLPVDEVGPAAFRELGEPAGMEVIGPPLAQSHPT